MSDDDDDELDRDDDENEDEEELDAEEYEGLPADIFLISGLQCLDEKRIFAADFAREKGKPAQLSVEYSIDQHRLEILTTPFETFASEEAYYTIIDEGDNRIAILVLSNLELVHMEMGHSMDDEEELKIYLIYNVESFNLKMLNKH